MYYSLCMIHFMIFALSEPEPNSSANQAIYWPLIGACAIYILQYVYCEMIQLRTVDYWPDYILTIVNVVDILQFTINVTLIILNVAGYGHIHIQRNIAAIGVILIFFKFFEWLKLFDITAFYIGLLIATMRCILNFMIIMLCWYFTIGTVLYIMDMGNVDEDT